MTGKQLIKDKMSFTEMSSMKIQRKDGKKALFGAISAFAVLILLMGATEARADQTTFTFAGTEAGGGVMSGTIVIDNSFLGTLPTSNVLTSQFASLSFTTDAPVAAAWDTGDLLLGPLHAAQRPAAVRGLTQHPYGDIVSGAIVVGSCLFRLSATGCDRGAR